MIPQTRSENIVFRSDWLFLSLTWSVLIL